MGAESTVVCFVDDDPAEVTAFKNVFGGRFTVVADTTPQAVIGELRRRRLRANLFVLDLYFAQGRESSEAERGRMVELKGQVDRTRQELSAYLSGIGQSRDGGLEILEYLQSNYPATPVVFYTRKGTLDDAVVCLDRGADGVFPKAAPSGFDPSADRAAQLEQAARALEDEIAARLSARASSNCPLKKLVRAVKFVVGNWGKF
jgi:CheY-like chemotaxis protein